MHRNGFCDCVGYNHLSLCQVQHTLKHTGRNIFLPLCKCNVSDFFCFRLGLFIKVTPLLSLFFATSLGMFKLQVNIYIVIISLCAFITHGPSRPDIPRPHTPRR